MPDEGWPTSVTGRPWDPPRRLVIRRDHRRSRRVDVPDGDGDPRREIDLPRRAGRRLKCFEVLPPSVSAHLRYVHSGILADGWEDQYDAIGAHTDFYRDFELAAHDGGSSVVGLVIFGCSATTKRWSRPPGRVLVVVLGDEAVDRLGQLDDEGGPL